MPLFDVPGWDVDSPLVAETSVQWPRKRKRSSGNTYKLQSAEVNFEKLVKRFTAIPSTEQGDTPGPKSTNRPGLSRDNKSRKAPAKPDGTKERKRISRPRALKPLAARKESTKSLKHTKRIKTKHAFAETMSSFQRKFDNDSNALTSLQSSMKQSLDGARFRQINEYLYKMDSSQAHRMIRDDAQIFEDYHTGFRHQVETWPINPVQHYTSLLSKYPPKTVIADLGCGEAALARNLVSKGMNVLSFDLVTDGAFVVETDICNRIPLPGSDVDSDEISCGKGQIVDVTICSLSLMGTNWPNCLREAWRILKPDGELKIAEVTSRITDIQKFQNLIQLIGFQMISKDESNSHFMLFDFKKIPNRRKSEKEWSKVVACASILKPCEYKRR